MSSADPIGIYAEQTARRDVAVSRLSLAAKHANFPRLYAKPMPLAPDAAKEENKRLVVENAKLKAQVASLEARIRLVEANQTKMTLAAGLKIRTSDVLPQLAVDRIVKTVARHWEVDPATLRMQSRFRRFVHPRQAAYRLLSELLNLSMPTIGRYFNRDHTTVLFGLHSTNRLYDTNADWRRRFDAAHAELTKGATP